MAGNDDDLSCNRCGVWSRVTFNAVKIETYTVIVTGYQHSVGKFTLLVECHGSSYNSGCCSGVCEGDGDDADDKNSDYNYDYDYLKSCVGTRGYNEDYNYGNADVDVLVCLYSCAEDVCGITF